MVRVGSQRSGSSRASRRVAPPAGPVHQVHVAGVRVAVSDTIKKRTAAEVLEDFAPYGSKDWRAGLRVYLASPTAKVPTVEAPTAEAPRPVFCADRPYEQLRNALLVDNRSRVDPAPFYNEILGAWNIEAQRRDEEQKVDWERSRNWWRPRSLWNERQGLFAPKVVEAVETLRAALFNEEAEFQEAQWRFDQIPVATYEVVPPEDDQRKVPRHHFAIRMADILRGKSKVGRPSKGDNESVQEPRNALMGYLTRNLELADAPASKIVRDAILRFFPNGSPPAAAAIREDWARHQAELRRASVPTADN